MSLKFNRHSKGVEDILAEKLDNIFDLFHGQENAHAACDVYREVAIMEVSRQRSIAETQTNVEPRDWEEDKETPGGEEETPQGPPVAIDNVAVEEYLRKNYEVWMSYPELKDIMQNTLKYERKEIEILHPYACYSDNRHLNQKIKVYFEGETLNGSPHGYCFVRFVHEGDKVSDIRSFKGVGLMLKGEFHRGPALFLAGDGQRFSFSFMSHGRPHGFGKYYRPDGHKSCIESKTLSAETSGWAHQIGCFNDGR
jgi:hypothetical protein